jgi:hypothetical protein
MAHRRTDFSKIATACARDDDNLFHLATCASFIESGADLYTSNLVDYFRDDAEVFDWLRTQWEPEELQHGRALKSYVQHAWPDFDWDTAYRSFLDEYATYCKVELLAPTRALEMAARCVVETGTATYYTALARSTTEPVLRDLASRIAADEVSHYKHFYHFFRRYQEAERRGRARVLLTLGRRTLQLRSEDADCDTARRQGPLPGTRWRHGLCARRRRAYARHCSTEPQAGHHAQNAHAPARTAAADAGRRALSDREVHAPRIPALISRGRIRGLGETRGYK